MVRWRDWPRDDRNTEKLDFFVACDEKIYSSKEYGISQLKKEQIRMKEMSQSDCGKVSLSDCGNA